MTAPANAPGRADRATTDHGRLRALIDYGPLGLFFAANFLLPATLAQRIVALFTHRLDMLAPSQALLMARVIVATAVFVAASAIALVIARAVLRRVPPMLLISGGLVLLFGGLTMYFLDPRFIQMKPTIVYAMLAATLGFGVLTGRPLLQQLMGSVYPGLSEAGWRRLTINWTLFFVAMAIANEAVWRIGGAVLGEARGWDLWTIYKVWVVIPLTFVFALANIPMLTRHGLTLGEEKPPIPPEG